MSKEQCVNKKLHPYYKTGVYGWIGEEVDDNGYIICPICGDVLGINYCDYSAEQGYYDKCPKCKQELDYSEIYDFEDTCYFEQLLEIKESRLADLEEQLSNAIIPKFKIGQDVWFIYDENDDFDYTILNKKVMAYTYSSYEGDYFEYAMSNDGTRDTIWYGYIDSRYVFATKEEAQAKLEELKNG